MTEDDHDHGADASDAVNSDLEDETGSFSKDHDSMAGHESAGPNGAVKKKYDPKDPSRPRRKKARRACYACQRAHLTCGDERPCRRCIKRGLGDACQDGVRKKAKYLHDAPPEALRPVLGPNYNPGTSDGSGTTTPRQQHQQQDSSAQSDSASAAPASDFYSQSSLSTFATPMYPTQPGGQQPTQAGAGGGAGSGSMAEGMSFASSQPPSTVSPSFNTPGSAADNGTPQVEGLLGANPQMDLNALFDPSNPALYNFDLEGLDFGSQYAGWEFGILNKMGLGAETPPRENSMSQTTPTDYSSVFGSRQQQQQQQQQQAGFDGSSMAAPFASGLDGATQTMYTQGNLQHGLPHAYAIAAGPTSLASPSTDATASPQNVGTSPGGFGGNGNGNGNGNNGSGSGSGSGNKGMTSTTPRIKPKQLKLNQSILGKRPQRDTASVYDSVKEPYPYTAGFHNMVLVLRKRLPINKLLRIAKTLSEIRPSFISSTKDLTREDLVFMEKCFQRTLIEFDDFLQHCCAPTIVCRRSGEVAAVNKEFTALTGWTKKVLLGKEANQDNGQGTPSKTQHQRRQQQGMLSNRVTTIDGEHGISRIEQDGKVACTYCWTIKRDVFDIPMMIIINFLPRYYPNQEPSQLMV
ncbi:GAL4 [Geosmithia morbida]|uniref:GAL4 n=1 Tax=Geosmithia morbida TaxID=1094350 RepID=A0A9P4YZ52_9HYPO|nr:GAL4 [Geosmithia morbida]KAF4125580.1 GAL4 [Geosmithia morbida]